MIRPERSVKDLAGSKPRASGDDPSDWMRSGAGWT